MVGRSRPITSCFTVGVDGVHGSHTRGSMLDTKSARGKRAAVGDAASGSSKKPRRFVGGSRTVPRLQHGTSSDN